VPDSQQRRRLLRQDLPDSKPKHELGVSEMFDHRRDGPTARRLRALQLGEGPTTQLRLEAGRRCRQNLQRIARADARRDGGTECALPISIAERRGRHPLRCVIGCAYGVVCAGRRVGFASGVRMVRP
jgi:hypothetical protein